MITIKSSNGTIVITGHAGYAPHGQDIVCAGVSVLTETLIASVEELTEDIIEYDMQSGSAVVRYRNLSEQAQLLIDSFFVGIRGIASAYPDYVMISENV